MDGFFQNYPNAKKIITIGAIVLVIIVAGIIGYNIYETQRNHYGKAIKINAFASRVDALSKDQRDNIEHQLFEIVAKNNGNTSAEDATIRDDDFVAEKDYISFIVDIDSISQSYQVQAELTDANTGYPTIVSCLYDKTKVRYQDFNCKDDFSSDNSDDNSKTRELVTLLPHTDQLPTGEIYTIETKYKNNKQIIIINVNNCGNAELKQQAVTSAKQFLESAGFNSNQYTYEVPSVYNNCTVK